MVIAKYNNKHSKPNLFSHYKLSKKYTTDSLKKNKKSLCYYVEYKNWIITVKIRFIVCLFLFSALNASAENASNANSSFRTLEDCGIETSAIGKMAHLLYTQLNRKAEFWTPSQGMEIDGSELWKAGIFKTTSQPQTHHIKTLERTKKSTNTEAVKEFLRKKSKIDCVAAVFIVVANLIAQKAPDELNVIENFGTIYNPTVMPFLSATEKDLPTEIGEFGYIGNSSLYQEFADLDKDTGRGENVFCVGKKDGESFYMGFGSLFVDGPKTHKQILDCLYCDYQSTYSRSTKAGKERYQLSSRQDWDRRPKISPGMTFLISLETIESGRKSIRSMM